MTIARKPNIIKTITKAKFPISFNPLKIKSENNFVYCQDQHKPQLGWAEFSFLLLLTAQPAFWVA